MKTIIVLIPLALLLLAGCIYKTEEAKTYRDLNKRNAPLTFNMKDSSIITMKEFYFEDEYHFGGKGSVEKNNTQKAFDSVIDLRDANYIVYNTSDGAEIVMLIAGAAITVNAVAVITNSSGLNLTPIIKTVYYGGGGPGNQSCPFLYSYTGNEKWKLEGEVFGTGLGKGLEISSTVLLKNLPGQDMNRIKFTNERPETHYFNSVEVFAVEYSEGKKVYAANSGEYIEASDISAPVNAIFNKRNILSEVSSQDGHYWVTDRSNANAESDFEDVIYAELKNENNNDSIAVFLESINTFFSSHAFKFISDYIADEPSEFYNAIDNNKDFINLLKDIRERSALKIDVWNGKKWELQSTIYPEANSISFTSAAVIKSFSKGGKANIRLRALCDVWKIDKISSCTDFRNVSGIKKIIPEIINAQKNKLLNNDSSYFMMIPGQSFELKFASLYPHPGKVVCYSVKAKGYLYELLQGNNNANLLSLAMPFGNKINNLIYVMRRPEWFLQALYKI